MDSSKQRIFVDASISRKMHSKFYCLFSSINSGQKEKKTTLCTVQSVNIHKKQKKTSFFRWKKKKLLLDEIGYVWLWCVVCPFFMCTDSADHKVFIILMMCMCSSLLRLNVLSFTAFTHISNTLAASVRLLVCDVHCTMRNTHTQKEETLRAKEQKRLQRNKYNMMTFKYTEANSPTNLTINNAFLCSLRLCIQHSNKYGNRTLSSSLSLSNPSKTFKQFFPWFAQFKWPTNRKRSKKNKAQSYSNSRSGLETGANR